MVILNLGRTDSLMTPSTDSLMTPLAASICEFAIFFAVCLVTRSVKSFFIASTHVPSESL